MASLEKKRESWDITSADYIRNLTAMLYLRGLNHAEHFFIANNLPGAGVFNDNVFVFVENDDVVACFIRQREQKGESHKVSDHLLEYFISFREILQSLPWLEQQFGADVTSIELIHYTDFKMDPRHSVSHPDHILDSGGLTLNLFASEYPLEFFDELELYSEFLSKYVKMEEERNDINAINDIMSEVSFKEIKDRLTHLINNPSRAEILKLSTEIEGLINKKMFKTFLGKLKVFHSQSNCKEMEIAAKDEFLKVFGENRDYLKGMDRIFDEFLKRIGEWMEVDGFLTKDSDLWKVVLIKMSHILSETITTELNTWGVQFSEESLEELRHCLEENNVVNVLSDIEDTSLSVLKVHQVLENEPHILIDMGILVNHPCEVLRTWESAWCPVLVVQSKDVDIADVRLVCSGIISILQNQSSHKFILVSQRGDTVTRACIQEIQTDCWEHVDINTLTDLSTMSQESLLQREVDFQGVLTSLSTVLYPYPELLERIRGNLLISLLNFNSPLIIGHKIPPVIQDYFPRTLSRCTKLSRNVFDKVSEKTVLAICGSSPEELQDLLPFGEEPTTFDPIMDRESMPCDSSFLVMRDSLEEDILKDLVDEEFTDLHCLKVTGSDIEWKWSKGDSRYLKKFVIPSSINYVKCELASDITEKVVLVVGEPTSGKSTFLYSIARQTKEAYPSTWVAIIDLRIWGDYISSTLFDSQNKVISFLENIIGIAESKIATLDKLIFTQSLYRCGNIVLFIDGFEYVPSYLVDKIAFLLKLLLENKVEGMYITCSPDIADELQENFYNLPYTLLPLTTDDQKRFLISKWSKKLQDVAGLEVFVNKILSVMKSSIGEAEMNLSSLPLLTIMMSETFQEELSTYITTGKIVLSSHFNLTRLYDKFVEKQCVALLKTKRQSNVIDQIMLIENRRSLCDKYKTIGLMLALSQEENIPLDLNSLHYRYNRDLADMRSLSINRGCLIQISNGIPSFVYPTLPEYFAACRIADEFTAMREFLQLQFLRPKFTTLRSWFDRVLSKDSELHITVINRNVGKMRSLFAKGVDVNKVDQGGRTPLHLAAMYDMVEIVKALVGQGANVAVLDNILKWSPIRYADEMGAWGAIDILMGAHYNSDDLICTLEVTKNETLVNKVLSLACQEGYVVLIDFLYSHSADVRQVIDFEGSTALHLASKNGNTDLVQYLVQYEAEITKYGKKCRSILHYLNVYCSSVSSRILQNSTANVNVLTNDGSTPLMLAAGQGHFDTVTSLIHLGADINLSSLDGSSALHLAAESGHHQTVKCLVESGAEVNKKDNEGSCPLLIAAKSGYTTILFYLLQNGADANSTDNEGCSPLHWCSKGGYVESIHWLLKSRVDVNLRNCEECTALHLAAKEGHDDCVKCLIEAGADAEVVNSDDATAVHLAAKTNGVHTLICLSAAGVNMNLKNSENATPLHWACHKGHKAAVKCLIELGAQADAINNKGYTPLHIAVMGGHAGTVKCLIVSGVMVNDEVCQRSPILHIASRRGHTDVLRYLIEAGGDVNISDKTGATPLHWASWGGHSDTVELLLKSGANVELTDNNGSSPLHWSAGEGKVDITRALLDAGAVVDVVNRDGDTPLHWAAKEGHVDTAKLLIETGADFSKSNAEGSTPVHLAMMKPHSEMVDYFKYCGADITN